MTRYKCPSCGEQISFTSLLKILPVKPFIICKACNREVTRIDSASLTQYGAFAVLVFVIMKGFIEPLLAAAIIIFFVLFYDYFNIRLRAYTDEEKDEYEKLNNLPTSLGRSTGIIALLAGILLWGVGGIQISNSKVDDFGGVVFLIIILGAGAFSIWHGWKLLRLR